MVLYAKDIVESEFLSFPPSTSVRDAAKTMAREHQGFVIVTSTPANIPMGIVTEWDLLAKVVAEGRDPSKVSLGEIMSTKLVSVDPNEGIDRVAQLMADEGTRRVLVVKDSQVLGVIRVRTILARMREYIDSVSAQIARAQTSMF
jgi:CBS domain-containing protein